MAVLMACREENVHTSLFKWLSKGREGESMIYIVVYLNGLLMDLKEK